MAEHRKAVPGSESLPQRPVREMARTASRKPATPRTSPREPVAAAKAKTHFLQLLSEVEHDRKPIIITRRGRVVAHLVPPPEEKPISNFDRMFGRMKGTGRIVGDIVSPDWESWGPEWR